MVGNDIVSKYKALMNVLPKKKYYKVPKGIKGINVTAFWGDTTIEKSPHREKSDQSGGASKSEAHQSGPGRKQV